MSATSHSVMWGDAHVWKVGGKVFAIGGWEKTDGPAFTFKTHEMDFEILKTERGYRPAPYMASRGMKWIQMYDVGGNEDDLRYYLTESYRLVAGGLSKKKRAQLGIELD